ncbi:unnamed protein product [Phytophthora lilii]|uniref:Unnamed protein product n=1 Tax=Phytophthora lilii TaxID=2077276 RepID=A0A9W6U2S7_9STRA|nr:unnamed protein product [Phytophthora lilii]
MDYLADRIQGMSTSVSTFWSESLKLFSAILIRKPRGFDPLLDPLSCYAVLQLSSPERVHVVPGLLPSVRLGLEAIGWQNLIINGALLCDSWLKQP